MAPLGAWGGAPALAAAASFPRAILRVEATSHGEEGEGLSEGKRAVGVRVGASEVVAVPAIRATASAAVGVVVAAVVVMASAAAGAVGGRAAWRCRPTRR